MAENFFTKRRIVLLIIAAVLFLSGCLLFLCRDSLNFDSLRRRILYRNYSKTESGEATPFSHGGTLNDEFILTGSELLICSNNSIRIFSLSGDVYEEKSCNMLSPVAASGGEYSLVCDIGGDSLFVYRGHDLVFTMPEKEGESIIDASLSDTGRLTVLTSQGGIKGSVTVYDEKFSPLVRINVSSFYITRAVLSADGGCLAVATAGQKDGIFDSEVALYTLNDLSDDAKPNYICSLGNEAILDLNWNRGSLAVLCENTLFSVGTDGQINGSYSFSGRYLKGYTLRGDGFCSLLVGRYLAASAAEIITVDSSGTFIASSPVSRQVLSMTGAGRYLSVLDSDGLIIYESDLSVYHETSCSGDVQKVLQIDDGSVLLISPETVHLYIPD